MNQRRGQQAYTLLEILTVVTLLMILTAIVYPAFAAARFKARETTCISQMRQIVAVWQMYRQDWDGKDTGTNNVDFGLPTNMQIIRSGQYVPGYYLDPRIVRCPNRFIIPKPPFEDLKDAFGYFGWDSYPGIDYYKHQSEDPTWPFITCDYHDLAFYRGNSGKSFPYQLGITLNGSLTRKPLDEMSSKGQRTKILQ
ncbi:MAG: prepilin-type N-terminal cleavage/methylation domain-containing protein [Capsulimonadales bacterium]|nr:prepilin-type N-terminal cleavage/methylation domain-containing protein [Capsulimonadales bacterium]